MKNYINIIITLILVISSTNAQVLTGKIEYKKTRLNKQFTKNKSNSLSTKKLEKFAKIENKIKANERKVSFNLLFIKNKSLFKSKKIINTENNKFIKAAVGPDGNGVFYNSNKEILRQLDAFGQEFLISKQKYKWVVTKEKKKIGNYVCYKATTIERVKTRNGVRNYLVTAWFTPYINAPFGPIGYAGLPGVILELEARNYKYYATKINLNPKKEIKITKPTKGKKVTQEEFYDIAIGTMKDLRKGF